MPLAISESLVWLKTPIQYAKGIGPGLAKLFEKLGVHCFEDLLYHFPSRYLDYRQITQLNKIPLGQNQVVLGEVFAAGEVRLARSGKKIYEAVITDGSGHVTLKWFRYYLKTQEKRFKKGAKILCFGEITNYRGEKQIVHPQVQTLKEFFAEHELEKFLGLIPVYPSTEGISQGLIRKTVIALLAKASEKLSETLPQALLDREQLPAYLKALNEIHQPSPQQDWQVLSQGKSESHRRLVIDEFFYLQLGLSLKKKKLNQSLGFAHAPRVSFKNRLIKALPFELTPSQVKVSEQIALRMNESHPMNALLQGDVGSGKTIVALIAALLAVENGNQAALMAPTEILAGQHARNFLDLLKDFEIPVHLLTASTKASERKKILQDIQAGTPSILIGTHALIEADVNFKNLSLVVIDEQHRFGVRQRLKLMRKGPSPDVMVMTATPIPRSLAMTLYGDLDLFLMTDMPKGRRPIQTRVMFESNRPKLDEFLRKKINEGRQAYFVLPLIEESEKLDLKNALATQAKLKETFSEFEIGLLHGRMKGAEKEAVMKHFRAGEINILVSTTVIEVGIDVPNATLMIVEHAERFGLSQLHQLRGRVGRGSEKSYCILATDVARSEVARLRLKVMEEYADGFRIAEEDLKIRGPGDFLGTRQSGMPDLRVGNLVSDLPALEQAKTWAAELLRQDPTLKLSEHQDILALLRHRWQERLGLAEVG